MKKYIIGILAITIAFAGAAFSTKKTSHKFQKQTLNQFYYSYDLNTSSGRFDESNYSLMVPQPTSSEDIEGCDGSEIPCVILATGTTSGPDHDQVSTQQSLDNVTQAWKDAQP